MVGVPTTDRANQQYCGAKALIELVKPFCDRVHEGRTVEKGKHKIKVVEVRAHEVEHEAHFGEFEPYCRGLKYGSEPLKTRVS